MQEEDERARMSQGSAEKQTGRVCVCMCKNVCVLRVCARVCA